MPDGVAGLGLAAVREMLSNVARHARADAAVVTVTVDEALTVEVTDDGVGPPENPGGGTGLSNLAERARALGGTFQLVSGPDGVGSRAAWRVPLAQ